MKFSLKNNSQREILCRLLTIGLLGGLAFLFSLQCSNHLWKTSADSVDSSVFKYVAQVMLNGGMPYRDVFDHKGPLIYLLNVLGLLISKWNGIWFVELIVLFITFGIIYKICRLLCTRKVSLGILLISCSVLFQYFQWGNLTEEYALPFISASLYIFTDYFLNGTISKLRLMICGLSLGAVCMLRVNMIPVWAVMCIGVLIYCLSRRQAKDLLPFLAFFLIGFLILVVPIVLWLVANGSWEQFIEDYIIFNQKYSSFETPWMAFASRGFVFVSFMNETVVMIAFALQIYRTVKTKKMFDILYLVYFIVNLLLLSLSGQVFMHYGMIIVPALAYPFASFCSDWNIGKKPCSAGCSIAFVYLIITLAMPGWLNAASGAFLDYCSKDENKIDANHLLVAQMVSEHSSPEDKILVCGNWNMIYNLSERFACTKYAYQSPPLVIDEEKAKEYFKEISDNLPKVIVITDGVFGYEEVMELIEKHHYTAVGKNDLGNTTVYVK